VVQAVTRVDDRIAYLPAAIPGRTTDRASQSKR